MVRRPADFSSALPWPVFTRAEALRAGVSPDRLRRPDLTRLRRGLYALRGVDITEVDVAAALCRHDRAVVIVGRSAARILRIPLPRPLDEWSRHTPVDVATFASRGRSGAMVTWHDLRLTPADVDRLTYGLRVSPRSSAMRVTTPLRTWRDLAPHLPVTALVAAGDHLVRIPRPGLEGRERPWCTPEELLTVATGRHARRLREAAALVRIGADSPTETQLRLAFATAGLPEPVINVPLRGDAGETEQCPDFQWPEFKVCAEYDGRQHSDPAQVQRDIRRARAVKAAGCTELRLYQKDLENECADAVRIVRTELIERGWRPRT